MKTGTPPNRPRRAARTAILAAMVVAGIVALGIVVIQAKRTENSAEAAPSRLRLDDIPFDGAQAYRYLKQICAIGPRRSGSPGMKAQQKLLLEHFSKLGARVRLQEFQVRHPLDGSAVPMANLIVEWHPDRKERVLLATHYDTLPLPMLDPKNPRGTFIGANDGGSGTAVLMELGNEMPSLTTEVGVDFVFLDGEEFLFDPNGRYFLGSEYFSRDYVDRPPGHRYRWGVLLDMVGDADLQIYQERNSVFWDDTRPLVEAIWAIAKRLGVREFIPKVKHEISDDHLMLHNLGGIPTCDIIDFDYPAWHTQRDTPERCSALSLAKVGWVVREWLTTVKASQAPQEAE